METIITNLRNTQQRISRISWGGVIAGSLTTLVILILLSLLGVGIGMTTIDPMTEQDPFSGLGISAVVWWIVSNIVALFVGGMVAARTSGLPSNTDGAIHGFLSWGLTLLLSLFLITTTIGSILGGVGSMVSGIFGDTTAENIAEQIKSTRMGGQQATDRTLNSIKSDMFQLINKGENLNILPEGTASTTREQLDQVGSESQQVINRLNIDTVIEDFINDVEIDLDRNGELNIEVAGNKEYLNKEAIIDYLTNNTDLSEEEINGAIANWERKIDRTVEEIKAQYSELKAEFQELSEKATDAAGKYSVIAFGVLLLGAMAGCLGGATASPFYTVSEEHKRELIEDDLKDQHEKY